MGEVSISQMYLGTVSIGNLNQTYNGTAITVTVNTTPLGLAVNFTYNGSTDAPIDAGSYTVVGTISEVSYFGSATNTLVIAKANATVTLENLNQICDGTFEPVLGSTIPAGLNLSISYNGSTNPPISAGTYTVVGTIVDPNYFGSETNYLVLYPASITQQPQNQAQLLGKATVFNVVVSSPATPTFQWYFSNPALQTTAQAKAQISNGFVFSSSVTNGGSGYTTLPGVQFVGGGGSGAGGTAAVSSGQVTAITMTNAGSGYTSPPTVLIDPPNGLLIGQTNATLNLSAITTNNFGSYFVVITNFYGSITSSAATLTRAYPPGITNQPQSQFVGSGSAANFSVTSTGTPPFSFQWWMVSAQLTNATATPLVTNGFVLGATITKGGAGYLAAPTVQFVGGSGSGAGGTAVVSNRMVTAINITNAGSGYTTHPTIQIAAPTAIALTDRRPVFCR